MQFYNIDNRLKRGPVVIKKLEKEFVWGANEIAKIIGLSERATAHLLAKGRLPAKKLGGKYVVHRKRLLEFLYSGIQ